MLQVPANAVDRKGEDFEVLLNCRYEDVQSEIVLNARPDAFIFMDVFKIVYRFGGARACRLINPASIVVILNGVKDLVRA
jgi:hypothetical protein